MLGTERLLRGKSLTPKQVLGAAILDGWYLPQIDRRLYAQRLTATSSPFKLFSKVGPNGWNRCCGRPMG